MGFLDNLENNLKAMESREERDPLEQQRAAAARQQEREQALLLAPHADALKTGPFTQQLLTTARTLSHRFRTFIEATWIGSTLRLQARNQRLELRPTPDGILAVYLEDTQELRSHPLDLASNPETLLVNWLDPHPGIGRIEQV